MDTSSLPIFCINLNIATGRWERIMKRFEKYNINNNVERWEATTPDALMDYPVYPLMKPGEKACGVSHYRLWNHMVKNNIPKALILEDDACFRHDWKSIIEKGMEEIDKDDPQWDCIMLNAYDDLPTKEKFVLTQGNCCAAAYVISNKGASFLCNTFRNCIQAADWMTLHLQRQGHTYAYFPWLVIQEGKETYIQGDKLQSDVARVHQLLNNAGYNINNYDEH